MLKSLEISQTLKNILTVIVYIVFFAYLIYLIATTDDVGGRILYLAILVIVGSISTLYELLRFTYYGAIRDAVMICDPQKALIKVDRLEKYDLFKNFATSACILRLLVSRDLREHDQMLELVKKYGYAKLSSSPELLLISRHAQFVAYGEMGDVAKAKEYYHAVIELRDARVGRRKNKKIAPYFSWEEIIADYKFYSGSYKEGYKMIQQVSDHSMNNRERMHYHLMYARLAAQMSCYSAAQEHLGDVREYAGKNSIMSTYAEELSQQFAAAQAAGDASPQPLA